eukprot:1964262-Alexandrium_andersonii.AAC.1
MRLPSRSCGSLDTAMPLRFSWPRAAAVMQCGSREAVPWRFFVAAATWTLQCLWRGTRETVSCALVKHPA